MATPFSNSLIRFKLTFDNSVSPKTMLFTDLNPARYSGYSVTASLVRIKLTIYGPDGSPLLVDSTPSINGATSTWTKLINAPLDATGLLIQAGNYLVTADVSVDGGGSYAYTITKTIPFSYTRPVPVINTVSDNLLSKLTGTNATDYNTINSLGNSVAPTTNTHVYTGYFPMKADGTRFDTTVVSNLLTIIMGPNICTGMFSFTLVSTLKYDIETWANAPTDILMDVIDSMSGVDTHEVFRNECLCLYYNCIGAVKTLYDAAQGDDPAEEARLKVILDSINYNFMMYTAAIRCGYSGSIYCENIRELLASTVPCDCADDDLEPVEIIPTAGSGGIVIYDGSKWTSGTGAAGLPISGMSANDFHMFNTAGGIYSKGDIYKYSGSAWVFDSNIVGDPGSDGSDGSDVTAAEILVNDSTQSATVAGTLEKIFFSFDIATGATGGVIVSGDIHEIRTRFKLAQNDNGKSVRIYLEGTNLVEFFTDALINATNEDVELYLRIAITGTNTQDVTAEIKFNGPVSNQKNPAFTSRTITVSTNALIEVVGQNSVANPGDITYESCEIIRNIYPTPAP